MLCGYGGYQDASLLPLQGHRHDGFRQETVLGHNSFFIILFSLVWRLFCLGDVGDIKVPCYRIFGGTISTSS
jgi:hypothetical protein